MTVPVAQWRRAFGPAATHVTYSFRGYPPIVVLRAIYVSAANARCVRCSRSVRMTGTTCKLALGFLLSGTIQLNVIYLILYYNSIGSLVGKGLATILYPHYLVWACTVKENSVIKPECQVRIT